MEALGESELVLLEWRMRALSIGEYKGQEWSAVGSVWGYTELSRESSHWAQIQIPNKVQGELDIVHLGLCENWGLSRVAPDNVRLEVSVCGWIEKELESLDSIIFTSSNTPLLKVRCSYTQEI
jgi:hypothetical protein